MTVPRRRLDACSLHQPLRATPGVGRVPPGACTAASTQESNLTGALGSSMKAASAASSPRRLDVPVLPGGHEWCAPAAVTRFSDFASRHRVRSAPMRIALVLPLSLLACSPSPARVCATAGPAPTATVTGRKLKGLALSSDGLVYIDSAGTGSVRRANLDGSNDTLLYGPVPQGRSLFDVMVSGATAYVTEQELTPAGAFINRLVGLPLAGGAPTSVVMNAPALFFLARSPADGSFTMKRGNSGSEMGEVYRLDATTGAQTLLVGPRNIENAQVAADSLYFMYRPNIGNDAASRALHRAALQPSATDAQVGTTFCRGSFWVTTSGSILCSGYSSTGTGSPRSSLVTKLDATGAGPSTFLDLEPSSSGSSTAIAAEVGDEVIALGLAGERLALVAVNVASGATRALACDVAGAEGDVGTARAEAGVVGNTFYWVGGGATASADDTVWRVAIR